MLFPTHLLAGYVLGRRLDLPALWAVAGAALPDVVDKSLATVGVFELYQTAGHSLLALVVSGVAVLAGRSGRLPRLGPADGGGHEGRGGLAGRAGVALWVGWASHLLLDAVHMVVNGRPADVQFLAWPFVHHVPAVDLPPVEFALQYLWTPSFFVEVAMWLAAGFVVVNERLVGTRRPSD